MKKKNGKEQEPQYFTSVTNRQVLNYNVYYLSSREKIIFSLLGFVLGAVIAYIFYGGLGKDPYGAPTLVTHVCNVLIMGLIGFLCSKLVANVAKQSILKSRKKKLHLQFIDLLDSLSASLSAGQNVMSSFQTAMKDLSVQYPEDSFIVQEVGQILDGLNNNIDIEVLLMDLGKRSGIKDIENFGKVFETAYRKGGNIKDVVRNTHEILSSKTMIEMEIETKVSSTKNEQYIMLVMPVLIIGMIKSMGGDFADKFSTPMGVVFTTIGIVLFVAAFLVGRSILDIEV